MFSGVGVDRGERCRGGGRVGPGGPCLVVRGLSSLTEGLAAELVDTVAVDNDINWGGFRDKSHTYREKQNPIKIGDRQVAEEQNNDQIKIVMYGIQNR